MKILFIILSIVGVSELFSLSTRITRTGYESGMSQSKLLEYEILFVILAIIWVILNIGMYRLYESQRYKNAIKRIEAKAKAEGMTFEEYINSHVSQRCLEYCEHFKGNKEELKKWLNSCVENENLSKDLEKYLYKKYQ